LKRGLGALLIFAILTHNAAAADSPVFTARCAVCHQASGTGVAGVYPPLANSVGRYLRVPAGREYLVHVVSFGLMGPIAVHGQTYAGVMQAWTQLSDDDIAQVLNHVLTDFNKDLLPKDFKPLTADEVKRLRATSRSFSDDYSEREALIKALGDN
jgi:mono/diheme cytochrome c family protein